MAKCLTTFRVLSIFLPLGSVTVLPSEALVWYQRSVTEQGKGKALVPGSRTGTDALSPGPRDAQNSLEITLSFCLGCAW